MCSPNKILAWLLMLCASGALVAADKKPKKPPEPSALDRYIQEAWLTPARRPRSPRRDRCGRRLRGWSNWGAMCAPARWTTWSRSWWSESASAVVQGATKTQRTSSPEQLGDLSGRQEERQRRAGESRRRQHRACRWTGKAPPAAPPR